MKSYKPMFSASASSATDQTKLGLYHLYFSNEEPRKSAELFSPTAVDIATNSAPYRNLLTLIASNQSWIGCNRIMTANVISPSSGQADVVEFDGNANSVWQIRHYADCEEVGAVDGAGEGRRVVVVAAEIGVYSVKLDQCVAGVVHVYSGIGGKANAPPVFWESKNLL